MADSIIKKGTLKGLVKRYSNKSQSVVQEIENNYRYQTTSIVDLKDLVLHPLFKEEYYSSKVLNDLSSTISLEGVSIPLFIYPKDGINYVVNGVKRYIIAKRKKMSNLQVIRLDASEEEIIRYILNNMIENRDNPLIQAYAYKYLINEYNMSEKDIQNLTYLSHGQINNAIRLLKLEDEVKEMIINDELSLAKARLLVSLDRRDQIKLAQEFLRLNVRECEERIRAYKRGDIETLNQTRLTYEEKGNTLLIRVNDEDLKNQIKEYLEKHK